MTISGIDLRITPGRVPWWRARRISLLSLADQAVVSGLGVLTGIAAARLMGIEEFGRFALVMIFMPLAQAFQNAVLTAPVMSLAGTPRGRSRAFFSATLWASLMMSIPLMLGVMALLAAFEAAEGKLPWASLIASAGALSAAQTMLFSVRRVQFALGRGREGLAMDVARGALLAGAFAVVQSLRLPLRVDALVWLLAAAAAAPAAVAAWPIMRAGRARRQVPALVARCWPMGRWMLPTVLTTFAQEQAVWLIAGAMVGDAALGGLRAAQYVASLAYPVMASLENMIPARSSQSYLAGGFPALERYVARAALVYSPVAVGFPLAAAASPALWLRLFFGPAFEVYGRCLEIFAAVVMVVFARDMTAYVFRAMNRTDATFRASVLSSIVTMAVAVPLIRSAGTTGAAAAIAVGQGLSLAYLATSLLRVRWPGPA